MEPDFFKTGRRRRLTQRRDAFAAVTLVVLPWAMRGQRPAALIRPAFTPASELASHSGIGRPRRRCASYNAKLYGSVRVLPHGGSACVDVAPRGLKTTPEAAALLQFRKVDLKAALQANGLSCFGTKVELVRRLLDNGLSPLNRIERGDPDFEEADVRCDAERGGYDEEAFLNEETSEFEVPLEELLRLPEGIVATTEGAFPTVGATMARLKRVPLSSLRVGQELRGIVTGFKHFGIFVDVGAERDGFVHISRLTSENRGLVRDVRDVISVNDEVSVWVAEITSDGRLVLSMNPGRLGGQRPRQEEAAGALSSADAASAGGVVATAPQGTEPQVTPGGGSLQSGGGWMKGVVSSIAEYGLFVAVQPSGGGSSREGLVHVSDIEHGFTGHPRDAATIGDTVTVRIIADSDKRFALSMREDPHEAAARLAGTTSSQWLDGIMHHAAPFGIFVDVIPPGGGRRVLGLVHKSRIRDGWVEDTSKECVPGAAVRVRVVGIDDSSGRVSLSMRQQ